MRLNFLYLFGTILFLVACGTDEGKKLRRIVKQKVYVSPLNQDTLHRPNSMKNAHADTSYLELLLRGYNLVNINDLDSSIQVDLRYSDTLNFLKRNLYDGLQNAYFNCETAQRLCAAQYYLKQIDPNLSLLVLDASRPQHIQQMMWDSLKLHPDKKTFYLARPEETSLHNYGCAVDVTILDLKTNKPLDMGTEFDFFGSLAEPIYEPRFLKTGALSRQAYQNRLLLRKVMQRAKLNSITSEWWHFSMCKKEEAALHYELIR